MRPASSGWTPGIGSEEKGRPKIGNLTLFIVAILIFLLMLLPGIQIVLEDPSRRITALIVAFGILSGIVIILTLPRRKWEDKMVDQYTTEAIEERERAVDVKDADDVTAIIALRSVLVRRMQVRRRIDDRELRSLVKSPEELSTILEDELLEELVLEDPRFIVWKMSQGGEFLDRYERLMSRMEAWR